MSDALFPAAKPVTAMIHLGALPGTPSPPLHPGTKEPLGPEDLAPIQQAFTHHYAAQCGFCTAGMMLAAHAYVENGGSDDQHAIAEALGGHVCRCTGYVKIIEAVAAVARGDSFDLAITAASPGMTNIGGVK
jgi:xanthine dehydrogenase iron-sulfur cluster and FAD-binding subunit A